MTERPVVGVGAVAIQDDRILLVMRGKEPYLGSWTLPGGSVEKGEPLRHALIREVREETGLEIEVLSEAGIVEAISDSHHYVIVDYFVRVLGGDLVASDDVTDARWFALKELRGLMATPRLVDSLESFGVRVP